MSKFTNNGDWSLYLSLIKIETEESPPDYFAYSDKQVWAKEYQAYMHRKVDRVQAFRKQLFDLLGMKPYSTQANTLWSTHYHPDLHVLAHGVMQSAKSA